MKNKYLFLLLALLGISIQTKAQMPPCTECAYGEAECEFSASIELAPICTFSTPTSTTLHGFSGDMDILISPKHIDVVRYYIPPGLEIYKYTYLVVNVLSGPEIVHINGEYIPASLEESEVLLECPEPSGLYSITAQLSNVTSDIYNIIWSVGIGVRNVATCGSTFISNPVNNPEISTSPIAYSAEQLGGTNAAPPFAYIPIKLQGETCSTYALSTTTGQLVTTDFSGSFVPISSIENEAIFYLKINYSDVDQGSVTITYDNGNICSGNLTINLPADVSNLSQVLGEQAPNCPVHIITNETRSSASPEILIAEETIESTDIIEIGANVTYSVGQSIKLKSGFNAKTGSIFSTLITPTSCGSTAPFTRPNTERSAFHEKIISTQLAVFPNPFTDKTTIQYELQEPSAVQVRLYDINGRLVQNILPNAHQTAGKHQLSLDRNGLQAGMYYLNLISKREQLTKKVMILKK